MDDELQQLEAELRQLRPTIPSARLTRKVGARLAEVSGRKDRRWLGWLLAGALPAAALIAVMITLFAAKRHDAGPQDSREGLTMEAGETAPQEVRLKPVAAEKVLVSADDEGLVTLADGTQARRERLRFVDTITWQNPRTNASLRWSVPREEVRVVPLVFQ